MGIIQFFSINRKKQSSVIQKAICIFLIFIMTLPLLPVGSNAFAKDMEPKVESMALVKIFDRERQVEHVSIRFEGNYLNQLNEAMIVLTDGKPIYLTSPQQSTSRLLYFQVSKQNWDKLKNIESVFIGNYKINFGENGRMPEIHRVTSKVNIDNPNENIIVEGLGFYNLIHKQNKESRQFKVEYGNSEGYFDVTDVFDEIEDKENKDTEIIFPKSTSNLGLHNIVIQRSFLSHDTENGDINVRLIHSYSNQFRLIKNLPIQDEIIEMYPNIGDADSEVYFESAKFQSIDEYDIYFIKTLGIDPYTNDNKLKIVGFTQENGKGKLTAKVPSKLIPGEYYVVFTNKVTAEDPMEKITGEKILKDADGNDIKFTIVEGKMAATILDVSPPSGPDTGENVTITGKFLGTLNIEGLDINKGVERKIESIDRDQVLTIKYIGSEQSPVGTYKDTDIVSVEKNVKVQIGLLTEFDKSGCSFQPGLDVLKVRTQNLPVEKSTKYNVYVFTETILTAASGKKYVFTEQAVKLNGYTSETSSLKPEINKVVPKEIFIEKGSEGYFVAEDTMFAIYGNNFMITKYEGKSYYPIIKFDQNGEVILNKNDHPELEIMVFDKDGNVVDGSLGNEIGTSILLTIPKTIEIPEQFKDSKAAVLVTNPIRNLPTPGRSSEVNENAMVEFKTTIKSKAPAITDVVPNIVTVDGGEIVTINGHNFQSDVKVYIDGKEIQGIKRELDGKTITFKAPSGREGVTQLQVLNPGGGMAVWEFQYVKTYTDPKITDFSPKHGNTGTIVVIKGDNFLAPDPTASESDIYRLIGTRVLLQETDVNTYNTDSSTKKIKYQIFESGPDNKILETISSGGQIKLADYWHSVIFKDDEGKHYTLRPNSKGIPILSDGISNTFEIKLTDGVLYAYPVLQSGKYKLEITNSGIKLIKGETNEKYLSLTMFTPFKIEQDENTKENKIVGNKVKVLDKNTIILEIPILTRGDGWYDLTVLNPDTKRDSRIGNQGFYYYSQPQSKPVIDKIIPDKGSTDGGYSIDIIGEDFKDDGKNKSRVYINGIETDPKEIFVSVDGRKITVKVPPYKGDLIKEKNTDRITVPVVVVNPDGASASREDGFTYMIPTSHPQITGIVPNKGSGAGKQVVEIFGLDFRFFEPFSDDNRNGKRDSDEHYWDINGNGKWDDYRNEPIEKLKENDKFKPDVEKVLPKVYFGNNTAEVIEFSDGYLKVITPPGNAGLVDVYIVNSDAGISNKIRYTYEATNPFITSIIPNEGKKQGGDRVEVLGGNFIESDITVFEKENQGPETRSQVMVQFGNISNHDIPREQPNSGRIDNKRTTVELPGGLKASYDGNQENLYVEIKEGGKTYVNNFKYREADGVVYFSTKCLRDGKDSYSGMELICFEIKDRRLLVSRGYSPAVELINQGQLVVTTPSYYTVGEVDVTIINPDGGKAQGKFMYKNPDSKPVIINITKEGEDPKEEKINGKDVRVIKATYKGGHEISITGSDFRENAKISIGDVITINPAQITYMLPSKLTFKMPAVPETAVGKLLRVVVTNEDGGIATSDDPNQFKLPENPPIYIMFIKGETGPTIERLIPDKGSVIGKNTIKVEGKDFREGLKVYWGGQKLPEDKFKLVDYKNILIEVPPHAPGVVEVKVENPDGELSNTVTYTYISSPKISAVVDPQDSTETELLNNISVEGGQFIKIKGYGFMPGAQVIFAPAIKKVSNESTPSGNIIYIEDQAYILESGTQGKDVKVINSETITVVTPSGKEGATSIIVINPDNGASNVYDSINYALPELAEPRDVVAELMYDRYIKVRWSSVPKAQEYEVYVVINDTEIEFIGSTKLNAIVFSDLESYTKYKFIVKAIGPFGASNPSKESNPVRTGRRVGPPDYDGDITEKTTQKVEGNTAVVSIGTEDYKEDITIDMADLQKTIISIPAEVVCKSSSGDITIKGKDFNLKFNPSVFRSSIVTKNQDRSDAGIKFVIEQYTGPGINGKTVLSSQYNMQADFFLGREITTIENLQSYMYFTMFYDTLKADMRRLNNIYLAQFDGGTWKSVIQNHTGSTIKAYINKLGRYTIIGSR